jgi:hypothetical protein
MLLSVLEIAVADATKLGLLSNVLVTQNGSKWYLGHTAKGKLVFGGPSAGCRRVCHVFFPPTFHRSVFEQEKWTAKEKRYFNRQK